MRIRNFKQNTIVTRVGASIYGDKSFIGEPLIYIGVLNACIYVDMVNPTTGHPPRRVLELTEWEDNNWEKWIDPNTLIESIDPCSDIVNLQKELKNAIKNEDYIKAYLIKQRL